MSESAPDGMFFNADIADVEVTKENTLNEEAVEGVNTSEDPFSPHNLAVGQFIMTCRVYDVLMALLKEADAGVARDILELHMQGHLLGSQPSFSGTFLTDEMNGPVE